MKYVHVNLTAEQRDNLAKLADYLESLPNNYAGFHMDRFMRYIDDAGYSNQPYTATLGPCGSVGCAVGHGPAAGIDPVPNEDWLSYAYRVFGADTFDWCFAGSWAFTDNTISGAVARIRHLLKYGAPKIAGYHAYWFDEYRAWYEENIRHAR